jgi:hypothetical protein
MWNILKNGVKEGSLQTQTWSEYQWHDWDWNVDMKLEYSIG